MQITIEGKSYTLPTSLMAVTLQQRIDYDATYGKVLAEKLKKLIDIKDETLKEIEFSEYHLDLACKTLAFFGNIPLDIVQNTHINQVMTVFSETLKNYSEDVDFAEKEYQLQNDFEWEGEQWQIAPPLLNENSQMRFGEFLDAKQKVKELYELGNEKWNALLSLCCVYFRKKGEAYSQELVNPEGERMKLMKTLPLQYALHVGFFLRDSLHFWLHTFRYSDQAEAEAALN